MLEATFEVTELSEHIYNTLKENGGWMSRREIGIALGRGRTATPYDLQLLTELAHIGRVEIRQERTGTVRKEWQYRAIVEG